MTRQRFSRVANAVKTRATASTSVKRLSEVRLTAVL